MAPLRLRDYGDDAFPMRRLQQDFAARAMGLSDRFAEPEVAPEDRSGGAPAACAASCQCG